MLMFQSIKVIHGQIICYCKYKEEIKPLHNSYYMRTQIKKFHDCIYFLEEDMREAKRKIFIIKIQWIICVIENKIKIAHYCTRNPIGIVRLQLTFNMQTNKINKNDFKKYFSLISLENFSAQPKVDTT